MAIDIAFNVLKNVSSRAARNWKSSTSERRNYKNRTYS